MRGSVPGDEARGVLGFLRRLLAKNSSSGTTRAIRSSRRSVSTVTPGSTDVYVNADKSE